MFISPLRYPGGKSWLIKPVTKVLKSLKISPETFYEPFAGGANVGLSVARESLASNIVLCDCDPQLSLFWRTVLYGGAEELATKVERFEFSDDAVFRELSTAGGSLVSQAFRYLLRNRVSRSGIMQSDAGFLVEGENGKGLGSRWYPETLAKRLRNISLLEGSVHFVECDSLQLLPLWIQKQNTVIFLDPPYSANNGPGNRLYQHHVIDDQRLLRLTSRASARMIVTYHFEPKIVEMCDDYQLSYVLASDFVGDERRSKEIVIWNGKVWNPNLL